MEARQGQRLADTQYREAARHSTVGVEERKETQLAAMRDAGTGNPQNRSKAHFDIISLYTPKTPQGEAMLACDAGARAADKTRLDAIHAHTHTHTHQ
ncbi:hypothetical protein FOA52_002750 [Chlamydomonas sp. UWO 241]|nr:hypothetical protein FOA52_002750 [Chlamydomonas sp. UWO 241]